MSKSWSSERRGNPLGITTWVLAAVGWGIVWLIVLGIRAVLS